MKTRLLLIIFWISTLVSAQDYCEFNDQYSVDFGENSIDTPYDILQLPNGEFILLGTANNIEDDQLKVAVCKMTGDGELDFTFGNNGRVAQTWGFKSACNNGALQPDGKILIGGYIDADNGLSIFRPYVGRLNADGSPDVGFGVDGFAEIEFQTGIRGATVGINVLENGKIIGAAATTNPPGIAAFRLNTDGTYDDSFSGNGFEFFPDSRVIWQPNFGKALFLNDGSVIVVTKMVEGGLIKPYLCKFNSNGALDSNFGIDGIRVVNLSTQGNSVGIHAILDYQENIILGSTSEAVPKKYQVAKLSSLDGSLFLDFGEDGMVFSSNTDIFNSLEGLAIDPVNDDIYAVGTSSTTSWDGSIWKLNVNGIEQDQCDGGAMYIFPFEFTDGIQVMKFFSDDQVQLAGTSSFVDPSSSDENQNSNFYIPKFNPLGTNDINEHLLSIYPNPTSYQLNIHLSETLDIKSIHIRNQLGQIIKVQNQFQKPVSIEHLSNGLYFMEITTSKGIAIRKFIKN